jgi:hypothetical protein
MLRRPLAVLLGPAVLLSGLALIPGTATAQVAVLEVAREAEPVVLTGAQVPTWSDLPAEGAALPWPNGALAGTRDAHAGTLVAPPHTVGVPADEIAAYRWDGEGFEEIPVQVDERFPYFLSNINSDFAIYSAIDEELTYEWDVESWKKTAGVCEARYPEGQGAMEDPVAALDLDDEIAFMASDAGGLAPPDALGPGGSGDLRQQVAIVDPLDPTNVRYVYLFLQQGGSSFSADTGYVDYERDANADQWIDRYTFADADPEKLGSSNTGYGPNLSGTVCTDDRRTPDVIETLRQTADRFPRDGVTVTTDAYRWYASGRWMVRNMQVVTSEGSGYGPDLIDRWKGRAFQQNPDSTISLVGFEDEQVNWEANAALLGELSGPVRAIRETWGADSGTNTTKTETFYRDAVVYRYHVRVHPIPPDGLYTSWDYNAGVATTYYNMLNPAGVAIDGVNDDEGNIDSVGGQPAFVDVVDPTFSPPSAIGTWEQVSGAGDAGSLVYTFELKGPTTLGNPVVGPYYRDDKCFDDGTGDDPVQRPWPGEPSTDQRVRNGYSEAAGGVPYAELTCDQKQGAWGTHGVHYFVTHDTDNAFQPKPLTEIDAQQWQFAVPTSQPTNVAQPYGLAVDVPLRAVAVPLPNTPAEPTTLEYTGDTSGQATDGATLAARLTDADGQPLTGREVSFDFQDATHEAQTDAQGVAHVGVTLAGPAGDYDVRASFAGDDLYAPSSDQAVFRVALDVPRFKVVITGKLARPTLDAYLTDRDTGAGIEGRQIRFFVDDQAAGTAVTDANGRATLRVPAMAAGTTVRAEFDSDGTYASATARTTARG